MQSQCVSNPFILVQVRAKAFTQFFTKFIEPVLNLEEEPPNLVKIICWDELQREGRKHFKKRFVKQEHSRTRSQKNVDKKKKKNLTLSI